MTPKFDLMADFGILFHCYYFLQSKFLDKKKKKQTKTCLKKYNKSQLR